MNHDQALEKLELQLGMLVRQLKYRTSKISESQELKSASYLILLLLSEEGAMGVKQLSEHLFLDISTVSRQAAELLKQDKIKKISSETDRRAYKYDLTVEGKETLKRARSKRQERFNTISNEWTAEEIENFTTLLFKFNHLSKRRY